MQTLTKAAIEVLVDIRQLPLSRKKGFSKTPLEHQLMAQGIRYVHLRGLGAPKAVRDPYKAGGGRAAFRAAYEAHLRTVRGEFEALEDLARTHRAALMCVEREAEDCHRHVVSSQLESAGFHVVHY